MFSIMGCYAQSQKLCQQVEAKRLLLVMGLIFSIVLIFQSSLLPYQSVLSSLLNVKSMMVGEVNLSNDSNSTNKGFDMGKEIEKWNETKGDRKPEDDYDIGEVVALDKSPMLESNNIPINGSGSEQSRDFEQQLFDNEDSNSTLGNVGSLEVQPVVASNSLNLVSNLEVNSSDNIVSRKSKISSVGEQAIEKISKGENHGLLKSGRVTSHDNSLTNINPVMKNRRKMPPMSISTMNRLLLQSHVSSNSTKPRWSSERDQELLSVRSKIESATTLRNDLELYTSVFQNVSMFKRSYELMERTLKVYIYKEGEKPIFHQPKLKGIYSSEGWFMKLMEGNKQFTVEDPTEAHLFYLSFSSSVLRKTFYEQNVKNLSQYLKNYVDMIAQKYVHWNRTGGADHFFAACHDWAPKETIDSMGMCIRALCNANVAIDFKIGKDVSLPVTYVRMPENPLKSLGGKPPSQRPILAFFAGRMHGHLRSVLLKYWENKDADMKIFGPMSPNVTGKMTYTQHMKSSQYCICARGYEVHTPRVIEAIFYECVPVIISDNYVPPFFEVLDWRKFSVSINEKDIPHLKDILLSIPKKKYLMLQRGVKNVQRHFLWHEKPMKYDIFHMILHSIWYNRVFQIKPT